MIKELYLSQLEKRYPAFLKSVVGGEAFSPIVLRGGKKIPDSIRELHPMISEFQVLEKKDQRPGWEIVWCEKRTRRLSKQKWPETISVTSASDLLYLIGKEKEFRQFQKQLDLLLSWRPAIRNWLLAKPQAILKYAGQWPDLMHVVDYLLSHDVRGQYIRCIPVRVHTKFLEDYHSLILSLLQHLAPERFPPNPDKRNNNLVAALQLAKRPHLFPIRWLDQELADSCTAGMDFLAVPAPRLVKANWPVKEVWVVENATNLMLLPEKPGRLGLFGYGKAAALLQHIDFFHRADLFYWGDLDYSGFEILGKFRKMYPHVRSIMMDDTTIRHFLPNAEPKTNWRPIPAINLTPEETRGFLILSAEGKWIEQERLDQDYIQQYLDKYQIK